MKYNVVYVEDNLLNVRLVQRSLSLLPVVIYVAYDGDQALEAIQTNLPDLVLLDINLPTMSGIDVLVYLKTQQVTRDIPVIALTADTTLQTQKLCRNYGAVDFLTKPVSRSKLIQSIEVILPDIHSIDSSKN